VVVVEVEVHFLAAAVVPRNKTSVPGGMVVVVVVDVDDAAAIGTYPQCLCRNAGGAEIAAAGSVG
jgi:hypothetical protein